MHLKTWSCLVLIVATIGCGSGGPSNPTDPPGSPPPPPPPGAGGYSLSGQVLLFPNSFTPTISGIQGRLNGQVIYSYTGAPQAGGGVSMAVSSAAVGQYEMVLHLTGLTVPAQEFQIVAMVTTVGLASGGSDVRTHSFPQRFVTLKTGDTLSYRFQVPLP